MGKAKSRKVSKKTKVPDTDDDSSADGGSKVSVSKVSDDAAVKAWVVAAERFSSVNNKFTDVPLLWTEERAMLEPCLWPALLVSVPLKERDFFDAWGFDGGFTRSFRSALQTTLPSASVAEIQQIIIGLADVRSLMALGDNPSLFFTRHRLKMRALCDTVREVQLKEMTAQGHGAVAENARKRLAVDVDRYGAGISEVLKRSITATVKGKSHRSSSDSDDEQPSRRRNRGGVVTECKYCQAKVTGESTKKFFEAHNKVCKKRPG